MSVNRTNSKHNEDTKRQAEEKGITNMIKVCHLTSAHKSDDGRIFRKECKSLASCGYDVYLVSQGDSREEGGVHIIGLGNKPESRLARMFLFAKKVYNRALELNCDIYHIHDPELLPYAIKLKKHGKTVIFDSHENHTAQILERQYLPLFSRKIISKLYRAYELSVVGKIDAVITPCTFSGKNIFENSAKRTCIIANYSKLDEFYDSYDPNAVKEGYLCYTGTLNEANGVTDLVIASSKAGAKLVLAGTPSDYTERLSRLPEFSNVSYEGYVTHERVLEIMKHANIGAYINRHVGQNGLVDTFGIKVYEFMAMGLPVIVDETPYSVDMVRKYNFGICVKPNDTDGIAEAIKYLTQNAEKAEEMGKNGRKAVFEEFNWTTQEKVLFDLYKQLVVENKMGN